jgi:hypothetical protein
MDFVWSMGEAFLLIWSEQRIILNLLPIKELLLLNVIMDFVCR